jgi:hypothetical protein
MPSIAMLGHLKRLSSAEARLADEAESISGFFLSPIYLLPNTKKNREKP